MKLLLVFNKIAESLNIFYWMYGERDICGWRSVLTEFSAEKYSIVELGVGKE